MLIIMISAGNIFPPFLFYRQHGLQSVEQYLARTIFAACGQVHARLTGGRFFREYQSIAYLADMIRFVNVTRHDRFPHRIVFSPAPPVKQFFAAFGQRLAKLFTERAVLSHKIIEMRILGWIV